MTRLWYLGFYDMDAFTVAIVVGMVAIAVGLLMHDFVSRRKRIRRLAWKILDRLNQVYVDKYECRVADAADFTHLDFEYYDRAQTILENKGFSTLGDFEYMTLSRAYPHLRTFVRVLVDMNGTIVSSLYHINPVEAATGQGGHAARVVDLTTELTDGCFLVTTNAKAARCMSQPPQVMLTCLSAELSITKMLKIHQRWVRRYQEHNPETQPVCVHSLEDVQDSCNRLMAIKSAYRKSIGGGLLKEEMERICQGHPDDLYDLKAMGESVFREMQKLLRRKKNNAGG